MELAGKVGADDMLTTIPDRPDGELVLCALGFAKKQLAGTTSIEDFGRGMADLELACVKVASDQSIVTVDLPPLRKLRT